MKYKSSRQVHVEIQSVEINVYRSTVSVPKVVYQFIIIKCTGLMYKRQHRSCLKIVGGSSTLWPTLTNFWVTHGLSAAMRHPPCPEVPRAPEFLTKKFHIQYVIRNDPVQGPPASMLLRHCTYVSILHAPNEQNVIGKVNSG